MSDLIATSRVSPDVETKLAMQDEHAFISEKVRDERRAKAKTGSNVATTQTLVVFAAMARANNTGSGKSGVSVDYANYTSVEDYDYDDNMNESADAFLEPTTIQLTLEVTTGKRLWTMMMMMMMRKTTRFLGMLLWLVSLF